MACSFNLDVFYNTSYNSTSAHFNKKKIPQIIAFHMEGITAKSIYISSCFYSYAKFFRSFTLVCHYCFNIHAYLLSLWFFFDSLLFASFYAAMFSSYSCKFWLLSLLQMWILEKITLLRVHNDNINDDRQWTNIDQKSSCEPSTKASYKRQWFGRFKTVFYRKNSCD